MSDFLLSLLERVVLQDLLGNTRAHALKISSVIGEIVQPLVAGHVAVASLCEGLTEAAHQRITH